MFDVSYSPEKYGLEMVGEVDYSSGSYEFDLLTVWRRISTGQLLYAEDQGCSCPSPFELHNLDDGTDPYKSLVPATKHEIAARIQQKLGERDRHSTYESGDHEAADLIERLMRV